MSWGSGLTNQSKKIKVDSTAENVIGVNWWPDSKSSSGNAGSRISLRVTKRDDSKSPSCGPFPHQRIVTVSFSPSLKGQLISLTMRWLEIGAQLSMRTSARICTPES